MHPSVPADCVSWPVASSWASSAIARSVIDVAKTLLESGPTATPLVVCKARAPSDSGGMFFAPRAYELESLDAIDREIFGPILHVVRFDAAELGNVLDAINAKGYGLTMGVHSRIEDTVDFVRMRARCGNLYVNRNMIGATVGVQPFGGEGLSGTGPKAGGPHYLFRFATERTFTVNTTAAGGNASLIASSG